MTNGGQKVIRRLNGWQRIWLVFTVLWTLMTLGVGIAMWSEGRSDARPRTTHADTPQLPAGSAIATQRSGDAPMTREEAIQQGGRIVQRDDWFVVNAPNAPSAGHWLAMVGFWVVPPVLLYGGGLTLHWIVQGFRRPHID